MLNVIFPIIITKTNKHQTHKHSFRKTLNIIPESVSFQTSADVRPNNVFITTLCIS